MRCWVDALWGFNLYFFYILFMKCQFHILFKDIYWIKGHYPEAFRVLFLLCFTLNMLCWELNAIFARTWDLFYGYCVKIFFFIFLFYDIYFYEFGFIKKFQEKSWKISLKSHEFICRDDLAFSYFYFFKFEWGWWFLIFFNEAIESRVWV